MNQHQPEEQPAPQKQASRFGYDSMTIRGAKDSFSSALKEIATFEQAHPGYTGPVRLHIDLDFNPDD